MIKLRNIVVFVLILLAAGMGICTVMMNRSMTTEIDIVELNNISKLAQKHWDDIKQLDNYTYKTSFYILDNNNRLLFKYGENEILTLEQAIESGYSCINIKDRDRLLGVAVVDMRYKHAIERLKLRLAGVIMTVFLLMVVLIVIICAYFYNTVLKPFEKLKRFAASVAYGDLDIPLTMDKKNIFGAFTESFDILREQLKLSREKEYRANQSKKELVASLSHDIKTPVTAIKLTSELLIAIVEDAKISVKLETIYNKAEQIDVLVTDLFHSTLEELGELKVTPKEEYSSVLTRYFAQADYKEQVRLQTPPDCMIRVDSARLEQIIGNIITNSYKYADTAIDVSFSLDADFLEVVVKDYGKGVAEDELPLIFNKFYRGKEPDVQAKSGVGLGLHISKICMEKMGGEITARNEPDGFAVRLFIPLA